jgi:hypothetical protein
MTKGEFGGFEVGEWKTVSGELGGWGKLFLLKLKMEVEWPGGVMNRAQRTQLPVAGQRNGMKFNRKF